MKHLVEFSVPFIKTSHSNMKCEEEEGLDDQQMCNQESTSSMDQEDSEPPQIKEEQDELWISQEEEQLVVKQETEGIIIWTGGELDIMWKPEIKLHRIDCLDRKQSTSADT
ncbi:uncharacterized protein LOC113010270 isoform X5 [Astatotilapia calliptera]|uniref:uncharacterized protein LOC113010270 isoform X5 n=1 Tax=Astatotilapia calliptera TaxID=8154 RepID=UPI000E4197C0|nr:uncharacterized protein LOC113010270 isoform X5 [Astatotilapia calliptera]